MMKSPFINRANSWIARAITIFSLVMIVALYFCFMQKGLSTPKIHYKTSQIKHRLESQGNRRPYEFLSVANAQELEDLFKQHDYNLDSVDQDTISVPEIYLNSLPKDFGKELTNAQKKQLFVQTLLPFILDANREILEERQMLLHYATQIEAGEPLDQQSQAWINALAQKYRMKKFSLNQINELVSRVDIIPVAMALGQAIEETGWGSSYAARIKNSVFGITLTSGVKAYENLAYSVKGYMLNLNANPAYKKMRAIRQNLRNKSQNLCALKLMDGLHYYSELGQAYIRKVKTHITKNELVRYEGAQLVSVS